MKGHVGRGGGGGGRYEIGGVVVTLFWSLRVRRLESSWLTFSFFICELLNSFICQNETSNQELNCSLWIEFIEPSVLTPTIFLMTFYKIYESKPLFLLRIINSSSNTLFSFYYQTLLLYKNFVSKNFKINALLKSNLKEMNGLILFLNETNLPNRI